MSQVLGGGQDTRTHTGTAKVLRVIGLHKWFGDKHILKGIDLDVTHHEVVVLIGASGSGKSTLLKTINLLERVDDGQIFLQDEDITDPRIKVDDVRARIGVVFQQYNLFPHMNVLDNVTLALRKVKKLSRGEAEARGHELLERIRLADFAEAYPDRLSGGQQQRVAISRALATEPELLLLDEITSALDPQLVGEVLDLVRELKSTGYTIVMATHEMAFARKVADRVAFLHQGELVEVGTPEQIFEHPQRPETREFLARLREPTNQGFSRADEGSYM